MAENPRAGGLVKLKGRPGLRLRVGDWRVLIELDAASHTIRVKRVLLRVITQTSPIRSQEFPRYEHQHSG